MKRRFAMVDVFGARPLAGNPLAVVVDSEGLSDQEMLEITRWLNLSETTFLDQPSSEDADYRVRIFTLAGELPFAGHPTLGTCHVWSSLEGFDSPEIIQECGSGLVRLRRLKGRLAFEAPGLIREGPLEPGEIATLAEVLGVELGDIVASRWVDNGPGWVGLLFEDADAVLDLDPDFSRYRGEGELNLGVAGFYPEDHDCLYEVRAFFSGEGGQRLEDPVTGSLNASLAQWLISEGRADAPYVASQGTALGRRGRVHISDEGGAVWVGGTTATLVEGTFDY